MIGNENGKQFVVFDCDSPHYLNNNYGYGKISMTLLDEIKNNKNYENDNQKTKYRCNKYNKLWEYSDPSDNKVGFVSINESKIKKQKKFDILLDEYDIQVELREKNKLIPAMDMDEIVNLILTVTHHPYMKRVLIK